MRVALLLVSLLIAVPAAAQHVILLRHAEKADDGSLNPPLTAYGAARAEALIGILEASGLTAAITSGLRRTADTAAPSVAHFEAEDVVVGISEGLEAHVQATADRVRTFGWDDVILVVGHSNTIPAIIGRLGGPDLPDLNEAEYDMLYFMSLAGDTPTIRKIYFRPVQ